MKEAIVINLTDDYICGNVTRFVTSVFEPYGMRFNIYRGDNNLFLVNFDTKDVYVMDGEILVDELNYLMCWEMVKMGVAKKCELVAVVSNYLKEPDWKGKEFNGVYELSHNIQLVFNKKNGQGVEIYLLDGEI